MSPGLTPKFVISISGPEKNCMNGRITREVLIQWRMTWQWMPAKKLLMPKVTRAWDEVSNTGASTFGITQSPCIHLNDSPAGARARPPEKLEDNSGGLPVAGLTPLNLMPSSIFSSG